MNLFQLSWLSLCFPSVLQCYWLGDKKSIWTIKTLHQNPLATVDDVSGWGTGCSTLWQPHLPVRATKGATSLPRFTWKMAVKMACVGSLFDQPLPIIPTISKETREQQNIATIHSWWQQSHKLCYEVTIPAFVDQPNGSCEIRATSGVLNIILFPLGNNVAQLSTPCTVLLLMQQIILTIHQAKALRYNMFTQCHTW